MNNFTAEQALENFNRPLSSMELADAKDSLKDIYKEIKKESNENKSLTKSLKDLSSRQISFVMKELQRDGYNNLNIIRDKVLFISWDRIYKHISILNRVSALESRSKLLSTNQIRYAESNLTEIYDRIKRNYDEDKSEEIYVFDKDTDVNIFKYVVTDLESEGYNVYLVPFPKIINTFEIHISW